MMMSDSVILKNNISDERRMISVTWEVSASSHHQMLQCFMSQECFCPCGASATQHKSPCCCRLCIVLSSLTFLEERVFPETLLGLLQEVLCLPQREMSCCRPCVPSPCGASGPTPLASSCSEPCVARCADSTVVIEASPVVVTLPGPILTSFPQSTAVGSSLSAAVGSSLSTAGVPISSGGSLGLGGSGLCLPRPRCSFNC
ncbi:uncharacterized protein LOC107054158 isoform X3 [Gallus gallus]|uniref:uncharacterized protein LOC107054158 isoform X3 n=1 Tax=Gallus gallus TaxID=9031 RepID=UPI000739CEBE|nr:uncharacterized protein LOC107054158 isoform X3 [Gallus gallus]XP_040535961.1 uncharacterized protein LOC107054158 isoform X3 [Gallus gallus]